MDPQLTRLAHQPCRLARFFFFRVDIFGKNRIDLKARVPPHIAGRMWLNRQAISSLHLLRTIGLILNALASSLMNRFGLNPGTAARTASKRCAISSLATEEDSRNAKQHRPRFSFLRKLNHRCAVDRGPFPTSLEDSFLPRCCAKLIVHEPDSCHLRTKMDKLPFPKILCAPHVNWTGKVQPAAPLIVFLSLVS